MKDLQTRKPTRKMHKKCLTLLILIFWSTGLAEPNLPAVGRKSLSLNPDLKFSTLEAYEAEIKEAGVILDSANVCLFAPKEKTPEAKMIFKYLVKAYDELYRIVGRDTKYRIVVYHLPEDNPNFSGGTSNCTLWYGYRNLDFETSEEWKKYHVPHVSGYIEEMAHNFVDGTHIQFGWEMIGWSLGIKVTSKVADNPLFKGELLATRQGQLQTFNRYVQSGYIFPSDLPANQCDRIHAYLLWQCEQKYGMNFLSDFFKEVSKEYERLSSAKAIGNMDDNRNYRYQITLECFGRLQNLDFKEMLKKNQVSLTIDVKSLHPTEPGWDRRFMDTKQSSSMSHNLISIDIVDSNGLSPLLAAAYKGDLSKIEKMLSDGADVRTIGSNGWTALHMAAMGGHLATSQLLIESGADIAIQDEQGYTAADLAAKNGHEGTAQYLREKQKS